MESVQLSNQFGGPESPEPAGEPEPDGPVIARFPGGIVRFFSREQANEWLTNHPYATIEESNTEEPKS